MLNIIKTNINDFEKIFNFLVGVVKKLLNGFPDLNFHPAALKILIYLTFNSVDHC